MFKNISNSKYFIIYSFVLLVLTLIVYNYSPNPKDGVTDDGKYFRQVETLEKEGYFGGFDRLTKTYLTRQKKNASIKTSHPNGHHPLRVGRITLHYIAYQFNNTIFSGTYLSLLFYILLGLLLFLFLRQYWEEYIALLVALTTLTAPMLLGFSARAIMETQYYFFMMLMVFSCIHFIHYNSIRNLILFIVAVVLGTSFKETIGLFFPFMVGMIFLAKLFYNPKITNRQIILVVVAPVLILGFIYSLIFGVQNLIDIATYQTERHLINPRAEYHLNDKNGPWFQYFIDFFVLSPTVSILFFLGVGYLGANDKINLKSKQNFILLCLLLFFVYSLGVFALVIKHVRYAIFFGFIYRLFTVLFIINLIQKYITDTKWKQYSLIIVLLMIMSQDLMTYQRLFVKERIMDVWNRTLMQSQNFFKEKTNEDKKQAKSSETKTDMAVLLITTAEKKLATNKPEIAIDYAKTALQYKHKSSRIDYIFCVGFHEMKDEESAANYCKKVSSIDIAKLKSPKKKKRWKKKKNHATQILQNIQQKNKQEDLQKNSEKQIEVPQISN